MGQRILTNKQLKEIEVKIDQILSRNEADYSDSEFEYLASDNDEALLDSYLELLTKSKKQAQIKKIGLRVID